MAKEFKCSKQGFRYIEQWLWQAGEKQVLKCCRRHLTSVPNCLWHWWALMSTLTAGHAAAPTADATWSCHRPSFQLAKARMLPWCYMLHILRTIEMIDMNGTSLNRLKLWGIRGRSRSTTVWIGSAGGTAAKQNANCVLECWDNRTSYRNHSH